MKVISRRTVLGLATVGLFPWWQRSSSGQGALTIGMKLLRAAEVLLTTIGIIELIKKWTTDAKCGVNVDDLEQLLLQNELMDRKLNKEGSGILSLLKAYNAKSTQSWEELRLELASFLNVAEQFLRALNVLLDQPFKKFAQQKEVDATRSALVEIRAALTALAARPKPPTEAELKEVFPQLAKLASEAKRSAALMITAVNQRRDLKCPDS